MKELKKLDLSKNTFIGKSGKVYHIKQGLSVIRLIEWEKLQNHLGFGISFEQLYNRLNDATELFNKGRWFDGGVIINNIKQGVLSTVNDRTHPSLEICALIINAEDEDPATYDKEKIKTKIDDWSEYDCEGFFQLAFNSLHGLMTILQKHSQDTLAAVKENKEQSQTSNKKKQS